MCSKSNCYILINVGEDWQMPCISSCESTMMSAILQNVNYVGFFGVIQLFWIRVVVFSSNFLKIGRIVEFNSLTVNFPPRENIVNDARECPHKLTHAARHGIPLCVEHHQNHQPM